MHSKHELTKGVYLVSPGGEYSAVFFAGGGVSGLLVRYMSKVFLISSIILLTTLLTACQPEKPGQAAVPDNYPAPVEEWQEYRIGVLTDSTGWLRLVDLIWLDEGENSFGAGDDRDIRFPEGSMPSHAGYFNKDEETVTMKVADGVEITHEGEPVQDFLLYDGENRLHVKHGTLEWYVDRRGDDLGIRIYDMNTPDADAFDGFPRYEVNREWVREARFVPHDEETTIRIVNVLGEEIDRESPGRVEFTIDGELYSLDAFNAASGLFLMFADETSRTETYQAGRYMIIDFPDEQNRTVIDFNMAYNPPCAFSKFTTCQLPPPQNRLDVAIPAGEKRPVGWEGIDSIPADS